MRRIVNIFSCAMLVTVAPSALDAQGRAVIVVDPGHGGDVAGVRAGDILEKDIVLRAAYVLAEELLIRGFDVRLTRTGDYAIPVDDRRAMAEEVGAAAFVSLHFNGDEDTTAYGIEIYANLENQASADAARAVRVALEGTGGPVVVEARPWGFLASPTVPTVMIEAGFLTHPVERRLIVSRAHHRDLARMIADGISSVVNPN